MCTTTLSAWDGDVAFGMNGVYQRRSIRELEARNRDGTVKWKRRLGEGGAFFGLGASSGAAGVVAIIAVEHDGSWNKRRLACKRCEQLVRVDDNGELLWAKQIPQDARDVHWAMIVPMSDGGAAAVLGCEEEAEVFGWSLCASGASRQSLVVRLDSQGRRAWAYEDSPDSVVALSGGRIGVLSERRIRGTSRVSLDVLDAFGKVQWSALGPESGGYSWLSAYGGLIALAWSNGTVQIREADFGTTVWRVEYRGNGIGGVVVSKDVVYVLRWDPAGDRGGLWSVDVWSADGNSIGRQSLGVGPFVPYSFQLAPSGNSAVAVVPLYDAKQGRDTARRVGLYKGIGFVPFEITADGSCAGSVTLKDTERSQERH